MGFLLLTVAFMYAVFVLTAKRSLREAAAAIEADGRPASVEELIPEEIPAVENAAPEYRSVIKELQGGGGDDNDRFAELAKAAEEVMKENANAMEAFRALYEAGAVAEALAVLEEASRKEYRSDLDYSQGIHLAMPHIHELLQLSRILAATAELQAADGDHAAAKETALLGLRVARSLESEPVLISQLVRAAMFKNAVDTLQGLDFTAAAVPPASETAEHLRSFDDPAPFVAAMDMERVIIGDAMSCYSWDELAGLSGQDGLGGTIVLGAYKLLPPLRYHDRAAHMRVMDAYARNLEAPFSPRDQHGLDESILHNVPAFAFLTKSVTPSFGSIKSRMVAMAAESRITQTGLAVLDHRQQTGSYPAELSGIGGASRVDPFTGESLVYRPEANGFTLYSVGSDLADDGGTAIRTRVPGDIVWRYVEGE